MAEIWKTEEGIMISGAGRVALCLRDIYRTTDKKHKKNRLKKNLSTDEVLQEIETFERENNILLFADENVNAVIVENKPALVKKAVVL